MCRQDAHTPDVKGAMFVSSDVLSGSHKAQDSLAGESASEPFLCKLSDTTLSAFSARNTELNQEPPAPASGSKAFVNMCKWITFGTS